MKKSSTQSIQSIFGITIKTLREGKGMTQQELADYSDLDRSHISDIERGIHSPNLNIIFKLSDTLQIKPYELVEKVFKELKKNLL